MKRTIVAIGLGLLLIGCLSAEPYAGNTLPMQQNSAQIFASASSTPLAARQLSGSVLPPNATLAVIPQAMFGAPPVVGSGLNYAPKKTVVNGGGSLHPDYEMADPFLTPVGDALIPLFLMAFIYALGVLNKRKFFS